MIILPGCSPIPAAPCGRLIAGVLVSRPCACGTRVTAAKLDPAPGVADHNRSEVHRRWWARVAVQWQAEEAS